MRTSPLDDWLAQRLGARPEPEVLRRYQMAMIRRTLDLALAKSPFYARCLRGLDPRDIRGPLDLGALPLTRAEDLRDNDDAFLCVSQDEIARVVTLRTSGTTGPGKRIHFTAQDLEGTMDFFHHGLSTFADQGSRILILLPGERPASVGDLLARAAARLGARAVPFGLPGDPEAALAALLESRADCVVGFPVHVLAMARGCPRSERARGLVRSVLLCSDRVPKAVGRAIEEAWACRTFAHWGMTESGLGGGVECEAREGYHLREADLFVEVVDLVHGRPLPPGLCGEVVLTTLTRQGMPLIRYCTGDLAAFLPGPCPCGSLLRRLGPIQGRVDGRLDIGGGQTLTMGELDDALFLVPGLLDFSAEILGRHNEALLSVTMATALGDGPRTLGQAARRLETLLAAKRAAGAWLGLAVRPADGPVTRPGAKRILADRRGHKGALCVNS